MLCPFTAITRTKRRIILTQSKRQPEKQMGLVEWEMKRDKDFIRLLHIIARARRFKNKKTRETMLRLQSQIHGDGTNQAEGDGRCKNDTTKEK